MIDFWIQKLKVCTLLTLFSLLPLPALASVEVDVPRNFIDGNRIKVRVQVSDSSDRPITNLEDEDFEIIFNKFPAVISQAEQLHFSPPGKTLVIILLDMSGSMNQPARGDTSSQLSKLQGATQAIEDFITSARDSGISFEVALVPFGEPGKGCPSSNFINPNIDLRSLTDTDKYDELLNFNNYLSNLDETEVCYATDLYDPVRDAVEFLAQAADGRESTKLEVILFSDGYHSVDDRNTEEEKRFSELSSFLTRYPQVRVHTLGYGEALLDLRNRAGDECKVSENQLKEVEGVNNLISNCKLPGGEDITKFVVDEPRLTQIADMTNGISKFPRSAEEAVNSLQDILRGIVYYELEYQLPDADVGDQYKVQVVINTPKNLSPGSAKFRFPIYGMHKLPLMPIRLGILALALSGLGGIYWTFAKWSKHLKQEAERWL